MNAKASLKSEIEKLLENLKNEAVELIDFDRAIEVLGQIKMALNEHNSATEELSVLKQDYRRRIVGMLKAVMAGRAKESDAELAAALAEDDCTIESTDLIALYRKVSARFRDSFPASFKYVTGLRSSASRRNGWMDHKL